MINDLPTIFEVVTGASKMQFKDKLSVTTNSGSKSKPNSNIKTVKSSVYSFMRTLIYLSFKYNFIKYFVFG